MGNERNPNGQGLVSDDFAVGISFREIRVYDNFDDNLHEKNTNVFNVILFA